MKRSGAFLAVAMLAAAPLAAEPLPGVYAGQLERCIAAARDALAAPDAERVRHWVLSVDTQGVWREFIIRSEAYAGAEEGAYRTLRSRCRAERWGDQLELG